MNAVSIPHRQGPIHVVGYQAARIFENATKEAEETGVDISQIYSSDKDWKEWLPNKYGLIDVTTGLIINEDGTPSAQVSSRLVIDKSTFYRRSFSLTIVLSPPSCPFLNRFIK
jgi:hypothetical protein